jgi:uncharacterized membrane protein YphA (DoxX/SURF4 family)
MRALFVLGRAIFGGYFLYNGINHLRHREMMSQYAAAKGVGSPDVAVPATGGLLIAGGASVLAGANARQGLCALLAFLVPVTLKMHRFWEVDDQREQMGEMVNFAKNVALIGAVLMMMGIEEPWPISVDQLRADDEEMYVRLGGRELRALPA